MKKTILITGASSGIGKETVKKFAAEGWNVIATMRSPEKENELTSTENILITRLDVKDTASITSSVEAGIKRFGKIDAVVNNAGFGLLGLFEAMNADQIREQFEVNVFGLMNVMRVVLPHFRSNENGLIINISSGAGLHTLPLLSTYNASKYALEGFSEAVSYELSSQNIKVKIVEPGAIETNFAKRSFEQYAYDPELTGYETFNAAVGKMLETMMSETATAADVADVIYEAATDGTDRVRYLAGTENFKKRMADSRQLSDQQYIDYIKTEYGQYVPASKTS